MKCTKSKEKVKWEIDENFIKNIKYALLNDKYEVAGSLLFKDVNCNGNVCDKQFLRDYRVNGEKFSVKTPNGVINYHTHPLQCYIDEGTKYGWPSGEDMAVNMNYAKNGTLVHIVFSIEGSYVIKINTILGNKDTDVLEKLLKATHVYRLKNQSEQLRDFSRHFGIKGRTTVEIWLKLVNRLSVKKLYTIYNKIFKKNLEVPDDTRRIFEVIRIPLHKPLIFSANFISGECHKNHFNSFN
jgi:hypothetical protein